MNFSLLSLKTFVVIWSLIMCIHVLRVVVVAAGSIFNAIEVNTCIHKRPNLLKLLLVLEATTATMKLELNY